MKWYGHYSGRSKRRIWYTPRYTKKGICYEVELKKADLFTLSKCGIIISKHETLQSAIETAEHDIFKEVQR